MIQYQGITSSLPPNRDTQMTRLQITIKDSEKAVIVINLLKELPFVEIEGNTIDKKKTRPRK
jgi:hypothetical protein